MLLISSDRVGFVVESFFVLNGRLVNGHSTETKLIPSIVLADAHELISKDDKRGDEGSKSPVQSITFDDPVLESSDVIKLFLELATTLDIDTLSVESDTLLCGRLIHFLDKWGCDPLQHLILEDVRSAVRDICIFPLPAFYLGAAAGARDICVAVLKQDWPTHWSDTDPWWSENEATDTYPFDSPGWARDFWLGPAQFMPPLYLAALIRSTVYLRTGIPTSYFKEEAVKIFLNVLDDA
jgi:hypothetical protein